ncbi:Dihydroxy-acid dehydratase [Hibiscus syriacus]|uniref:Dihydroxy-acid dehydratase n=1 Tax=Hibiscus syriacus TaxID=106335 RepID=A0A6A3BEP0_HIBSY|nr:Dihydroxy-acid dehydratase [Hibiscus syriacus]
MNLGIVHGRSVGLELSLDDLQKVSDEVPFLADLKPSDKYVLEDVHKIGGTPAVIRYLLELGYLGGDCMTVTGKKMAENAQSYPRLPDGQVGPALVFEGEEAMLVAISENPSSFKGKAVVIRGVGPKGGPGMPEMLTPTSAIMGAGLGKVPFSGGSRGFVVGHICPEAQDGGSIRLVQNGDLISIDVQKRAINVELTDAELNERRKKWNPPPLKADRGVLHKEGTDNLAYTAYIID